jgi:hypothetical protein
VGDGPAAAQRRSRHRPDPQEVAVLKKVLAWLVVAFVVFYIINQPQSSADIVKNVGETLGNAATSLASFVRSFA